MANEGLTGTSRLRAATSGSRKSGARAMLFWGVALLAGLGAAMMIARYLDQQSTQVSAPVTKVVVAAQDLPLATRLKADQLKTIDWPVNALMPGVLQDEKEVVDRVLTSRVLAGEPIMEAKLAAKDAGNGLAALIPQHLRAMAVRVDDVVGVAGFIHPDDRVDVIATMHSAKVSQSEATAKVILQNVKVLAVGKELEVEDKDRRQANPAATVATLLVDPAQAEKLALASTEGRLILTLRSWTDDASVDTPGMSPTQLLVDSGMAAAEEPAEEEPAPVRVAEPTPPPRRRSRAARTHKTPAAPTAKPSGKPDDVVEILRGDRFEERKFDRKGPPKS